MESEGIIEAWSSIGDDSNALILPKKKRKRNDGKQDKLKRQPKCLSKSQKRKLKKLQEEREKKVLESRSIKILKRYKISDSVHSLLQSSGNMGQVATRRERQRRDAQFAKVGLEAPLDDLPLKKRVCQRVSDHDGTMDKVDTVIDDSINLTQEEGRSDFAVFSCNFAAGKMSEQVHHSPEIVFQKANALADGVETKSVSEKTSNLVECVETKPAFEKASAIAERVVTKPVNSRTIVHVSRPLEVDRTRGDLPIVMMEQEIMEAIIYNSIVIICGETGCGKTTQVPQFLYEAGFASSKCNVKKGIIGVTQPRRVAVLSTAKRVAFELGLNLGREVGFQVRHDKRIGENCSIKFMTDGILLREVQSDFLLKRYSVIILDEAHERSLNTDILIGMLSRIIETRQKLYLEQQEKIISGMCISPESMVTELKLILMSATLRVEDFTSDRRLFRVPPPVIEVPTRQYPVTIHFSKRTEIVDYVGQAYKKVLLIHKKLPPGGILVFLTGQREVEYLCKKLRKASQQLVKSSAKEKLGDAGVSISAGSCSNEEPDMKDIDEAFESLHDQQTGRFNSYDEELDDGEMDSYSSDSSTDNELLTDNVSEDLQAKNKTDMVLDILGDSERLASLKGAFEALAPKNLDANKRDETCITPVMDGHVESSAVSSKNNGIVGRSVGALRVLPLYAMLPATSQLRVFEDVQGERLVVVATNVAETSLTIPGIKYVVDTGREKTKNYNCSTGMAAYEVQWISKASAAQRAGRAGRTGPGHCYRLYSSAVFNNIFPEFSKAEITKIPVDGVVLVMKFMGIHKVANFPFPTPPEASSLLEADRCLRSLEAIDDDGRLTSVGKAMALYPMSPRHSRMLLTVIQIMRFQPKYARANLVLGYTVASAAALSFASPFIMQFDRCSDSAQNFDDDQAKTDVKLAGTCTNKILDQEEKQRQKKLKAMAKAARMKFRNPCSDALTIAFALQAYELAQNSVEFCENNALHLKTMDEMSKLRKQLLQLIFHQNAIGSLAEEFSWSNGKMEDVECAWRTPTDKHPLLQMEEEILCQAICAGWADRVAMRIRKVAEIPEEDRKISSARYRACMVNEAVFLHRLSSVAQAAPEFLVYNELVQSKRPYMQGVTSVKSEWLVKYAKSQCSFSSPLTDPKPYYDPLTDQVLCWVRPTFGPHLWQLPLHSLPIKNDAVRVAVFAYSPLAGQILPCLKSVQKFMSAPPVTIKKPEAACHRRVGNLLNKLKKGSVAIDSRASLRETWNKNPQELHPEIMCWFQEKYHDMFGQLWAQMHREILLGVNELFPERFKKGRKS